MFSQVQIDLSGFASFIGCDCKGVLIRVCVCVCRRMGHKLLDCSVPCCLQSASTFTASSRVYHGLKPKDFRGSLLLKCWQLITAFFQSGFDLTKWMGMLRASRCPKRCRQTHMYIEREHFSSIHWDRAECCVVQHQPFAEGKVGLAGWCRWDCWFSVPLNGRRECSRRMLSNVIKGMLKRRTWWGEHGKCVE